jgi:hypothetical protein
MLQAGSVKDDWYQKASLVLSAKGRQTTLSSLNWPSRYSRLKNFLPMSEESQRDRLPFEPKKNRKKAAKTPAKPSSTAKENPQQPNQKPESTAVPEVVSKRMVSRIALFADSHCVRHLDFYR